MRLQPLGHFSSKFNGRKDTGGDRRGKAFMALNGYFFTRRLGWFRFECVRKFLHDGLTRHVAR